MSSSLPSVCKRKRERECLGRLSHRFNQLLMAAICKFQCASHCREACERPFQLVTVHFNSLVTICSMKTGHLGHCMFLFQRSESDISIMDDNYDAYHFYDMLDLLAVQDELNRENE